MAGQTPTDKPIWLPVFLASFALYAATLAPGPLWQDSGEVQLRVLLGEFDDASSLARSHVLYYLIAAAFRAVPVGGAAFTANLVAALFGAVSVANVGWLAARVTGRPFAGVATAMLLGLSHTLWQFSTGAEVLTLFAALLSAELCLLWRFAGDRRARWLYGLAFCNGLGLADHNFALLSAVVYVGVAVWRRASLPKPAARTLGIAAIAWLAGAAPLAALAVRTMQRGAGVAATAESLLVGRYGHSVFNVADLPHLGLEAVAYVMLNFPTPLLLLMPIGWWLARRQVARWLWVTWTALFVVHFGFAARYDVPDQYTFMIPSYVLLAAFGGCGIAWLRARWPSRRGGRVILASASLAPLAYLAAPEVVARLPSGLVPVPTHAMPYTDPLAWFLRPWRVGADGPARYARETLAELPSDAVLLASSTLAPPLLYVQHAENVAPRVRVVTTLRPDGETLTLARLAELATAGRLYVTTAPPRNIAAAHRQWIVEHCELYRAGPVFRVRIEN